MIKVVVISSSISLSSIDWSPECIRSSLLNNRLLVVVEQVPRVEHVKKIDLGVDRNGCLHPGVVSGSSLSNGELLKLYNKVTISSISNNLPNTKLIGIFSV